MGSAVRAKCECGYDEEFLIGGGMESFELSVRLYVAYEIESKSIKAVEPSLMFGNMTVGTGPRPQE
jgi:hypothetical protein